MKTLGAHFQLSKEHFDNNIMLQLDEASQLS
jgi:hypothetical protein